MTAHADAGAAPFGQPAVDSAPLLPVEPAYRYVLAARLALVWLPIIAAAFILDSALDDSPFQGLASTAVPLLAVIALVLAPRRIYQCLRYAHDDRMLRVLRGWMFHSDTIVPLVRVQHIDVTRGPLDKMFGTATLVVHTAGTHNSIVGLPGLSPSDAEAMRERIRRQVRTDFE